MCLFNRHRIRITGLLREFHRQSAPLQFSSWAGCIAVDVDVSVAGAGFYSSKLMEVFDDWR